MKFMPFAEPYPLDEETDILRTTEVVVWPSTAGDIDGTEKECRFEVVIFPDEYSDPSSIDLETLLENDCDGSICGHALEIIALNKLKAFCDRKIAVLQAEINAGLKVI